jgi:YidC/Oxa1 family membrane protein insertase
LDNSRLLLAFVISLGIIVIYSQLLQWRNPQRTGGLGRQSEGLTGTPAAFASPGMTPGLAGIPAVATTRPRATSTASSGVPLRTVRIETNFYEAVLTSQGARLKSFRLKRYRQSDAPDSPWYEMVREGERLPMGVAVTRSGATVDDGSVDYKTEAPAQVEVTSLNPAVVTFTGTTADGLKLDKTFTFHDSNYVFEVIARASAVKGATPSALGLTLSQPLKALEGFRDYPTLQADIKGKVISEGEKSLQKGISPVSGAIAYAGFGTRYFLAAFMPQKPASGTLAMGYAGEEADARMVFEDTTEVVSQVYMGPKELDILEGVNPALRNAIDFGFWGMIALPFLRALRVFYLIAPNYGVAIILLTVVVRLIVLPMSIKGQRSMMKMQRLQPQIERIREKFKDDKDRLNREMVDLYKRNHVNPMGGCLPMVIQLPVFFGLYYALLDAIELRQAPFIGWIRDLSSPDCLPIPGMPALPYTDCHGIPVLVLLMTISALVQQWIMPRNPDPNQQKMMMFMPVMFSLIFITLPAGLSLYYLSSNVLGVIQQFILNREFKQYTPAT